MMWIPLSTSIGGVTPSSFKAAHPEFWQDSAEGLLKLAPSTLGAPTTTATGPADELWKH